MLSWMRWRRRRLNPKAAAAPKRGRGPGVSFTGPRTFRLIVSPFDRVHVPRDPVAGVSPISARDVFWKIAVLRKGEAET